MIETERELWEGGKSAEENRNVKRKRMREHKVGDNRGNKGKQRDETHIQRKEEEKGIIGKKKGKRQAKRRGGLE